MARQNIKDFYGKIIGSIEELPSGDKIARDFYGKILGRYVKAQGVTKDFYGKIVATGDTTSALIWNAYNEQQAKLKANTK